MKVPTIFRAIACLLLLAGLPGCEKDVSDKLKLETTQQLAVIAFISPQDTALHVRLQRTQPAVGRTFTEEELKVKDAQVNLSDGSQTILLKYDNRQNIYRAKKTALPIVAGKTYSLNINTPNGWKASATCTVPSLANIAVTTHQLRSEVYAPFEGFSNLRHTLTFNWQDAPGQENYYRVSAFRVAPNPNNPNFPQQQTFNHLREEDVFIADSGKDGQEISSNDLITYTENPERFPRPYNLHLLLTITDRAYYQYHRSVFQQRNNGDNPFAEPTLLYTNITGGLGVFAASNQIHEVRQINN